MRLAITEPIERARLLILLPDPGQSDRAAADWWLVRQSRIVDSGSSDEWKAIASAPGMVTIGLAPAGTVKIVFPDVPQDGSENQRLTVARLAAMEGSIADPATLHAASALVDRDQAAPLGIVAVAANDAMLGWLAWAERQAIRLDHIVPTAMVLPLEAEWVSAVVGGDRIVGRIGLVMPDEPGLTRILLDGPVSPLDPGEVDRALTAIADDPRPDLRSGRFARRRLLIDRSQWKLAAYLAASVALLALLTVLVQIAKLERATDRLDAETLALAQRIAGPTVTVDGAEAALRRSAPANGRLSSTMASLLAQVAARPDIRVSALSSSAADVTITVVAASPQSLGALVQALRRDGFQVRSTPRPTADALPSTDIVVQGEG